MRRRTVEGVVVGLAVMVGGGLWCWAYRQAPVPGARGAETVAPQAASANASAALAPTPARKADEPPARRVSSEALSRGTTVVPGPDPQVVGPWADRPVPGVLQDGEPARARVEVAGKTFELVPNQSGVFQRVYVAPEAKAHIHLTYPGAMEGEPIKVQIVHGGNLAGPMARELLFSAGRDVAFDAQLSPNDGVHHIVLQKGADVKTLDFWVGPPLPVRTASTAQ